jgi:hypothetical protein
VADPFLAFHYRFVTPNLTALEPARPKELYDAFIAPYLDEYTSGAFEEMAREYVRRYGREVLPSAAREVGRIFASDFDVDVAGVLLDGSAVFGEAKWSVRVQPAADTACRKRSAGEANFPKTDVGHLGDQTR